MIIEPTNKTDDNVCANNNRIAIALNISLSINGVKYAVCGSNDDASTDNNDEEEEVSGNSIKSVRICTRANPSLSLTIRNGKVCMAKLNSSDRYQYWYKYEKYSASFKDAEGNSSFILVNKATGQAIQHSDHDQDVQLITFDQNKIDKSVLWTCKFTDNSYMYVRNINDITLLFDAWDGNGDGIHDGTKVILWKFQTGHNQLWKFVPFEWQPSPPKKQPSPPRRQPSPPRRQPSPPRRVVQPPPPPPKKKSTYKPLAGNQKRIYPSYAPHLSLTVRDGEVVLANKNIGDVNQHWLTYTEYTPGEDDVQGQATFSIANNGTGWFLQHAIGHDHPIRLTNHYFKETDRSILWASQHFVDSVDSFCTIRSVNDSGLELVSANEDGYRDGIKALLYNFRGAGHQYWKITDW